MAGIVAVTRFCEALSEAFSSYIDYMDRDSATKKEALDKYNLFDDYLGYMDNEEKTIIDDYKQGTEKVSALFTATKDILQKGDKAQLKVLFKVAQENGSNMWQTVISFENDYLEEVGIYDKQSHNLNEKLLIQASRSAINKMLEKEGLENAVWAGSFHYNTDNIHIHVATVEPLPMRETRTYKMWEKDEKGKIKKTVDGKKIPVIDALTGEQRTYEAYKGTFKQSSIEFLKSRLRSELENNKETYTEITSLLRGIVSDKKETKVMNNEEFKDKMDKLYRDIKKTGLNRRYWNYNQNNLAGIKPQIDDLSDLFINIYHKDDYMNLIAKMEKEAVRQTNAYGGDANEYVFNQLHHKSGGIYTRLGNAILKELANYEKEKVFQQSEVKKAEKYLIEDEGYNPEKAIKMLNELSDRGNTFAQNRLGLVYLRGEGVNKDTKLALSYFSKSSSNGNTYGRTMVERINKGDFKEKEGLYYSSCNRDIKRALRMIERNMNVNYDLARNMHEAELLQLEIDARGQEL